MVQVSLLENPIQDYAWGSRTALASLCGRAPSGRPEAELWMGAHPAAPSRLRVGGRSQTLAELIDRQPVAVLGRRVAEAFGGRLPFLFKVLAVERPLSVQAHPDAEQAARGFARENAAGLAADDPQRSYRDASPKPELVCALSPFRALRGFRPVPEIRARFRELGVPALAGLESALAASEPSRALRDLLSALFALRAPDGRAAIEAAVAAAEQRADADPAFDWVIRLAREHPGDPAALAPLLLHLVALRPGEAMFLPARELHSYLEGTAVELMGNSDNVLRGGLTGKHVDGDELLRVLAFRETEPEILRPAADAKGCAVYPTPAREFELSRIEVREGAPFPVAVRGAEILLCVEGKVSVGDGGGEDVVLPRGASCLVPAALERYRLAGKGRIYRAAVPDRGAAS